MMKPATETLEESIRERTYHLWEASGRPGCRGLSSLVPGLATQSALSRLSLFRSKRVLPWLPISFQDRQ